MWRTPPERGRVLRPGEHPGHDRRPGVGAGLQVAHGVTGDQHAADVPHAGRLHRPEDHVRAAREPFPVAEPAPGVRVVSVTSGIGMTTALGLAPEVLDGLLA